MSWMLTEIGDTVDGLLGYMPAVRPVLQYACIPVLLVWISIKLWDWLVCESRDKSCDHPLPPGGSGLPLIGNSLPLVLSLLFHKDYFDKEQANSKWTIYRTHVLGKPTIRVKDANLVRQLFRRDNIHLTPGWPKPLLKLIGQDLLFMSRGPPHARKKMVLATAFTPVAVDSYIPEILHTTKEYIGRWCKEEKISCYEQCQRLGVSLAWKVILGSEEPLYETMTDFFGGFFAVPVNLPGFKFHKAMKASNLIRRETERILKEEKSKCTTILDWIKHAEPDPESKGINMLDVPNELLFAAFATVSSTLTSTVLLLGQHPQVIDRLQQEFENHGLDDPSQQIDFKKLASVKLLRNVVDEVLRLYPPAGSMYRDATKTMVLEGYQIPKGWRVVLNIKESQTQNSAYDKPLEFNPDRWDVLRGAADHRGEILAFAMGSRLCLGKNYALSLLYVFILQLVTTCRWKLLNPHTKVIRVPVCHPTDGLPSQFTAL